MLVVCFIYILYIFLYGGTITAVEFHQLWKPVVVVVTTMYGEMTREGPGEISHSQALRDLAVSRKGLWVTHSEHQRGLGLGLSILPRF